MSVEDHSALETAVAGGGDLSHTPCQTPRKDVIVTGHRIRFRNATEDDAEFIFELRLDERKNQYLSKTAPTLQAQVDWLKGYASDDHQAYFIIEDLAGERVGTVRIYDVQGSSFCWGSWILADNAPKSSAVESTLMVYAYALACGFTESHFDVRKGNERVWQYHERMGARRVAENELDYFYTMAREDIEQALEKYRSRLPEGITIVDASA